MCEEEETPTVFVVPPNNSLKCPLHFGVLEDPVDAPCGCTFCRSCITQLLSTKHECPLHERPIYLDQLRTNEQAKVIVDDLLIHCKGGLQKTVSGEWITSPTGCKLWITLGKRKEHEDNCMHVKKLFNSDDSNTDKPLKPPIKTCVYYQYGCLFVGHTDQEMLLHQEMCGSGKLLQHISQLKSQLAQKDAEIARLNALVAEQDNTMKSIPSVPNVNNILDSMSRGIESTRLFEDAKSTLQKTKSSFKNSSVYQTSLEVLNSIKEVVETARAEFVAKLEELERMAKYKFRQFTGGNDIKRITNKPENSNNTTNTNNDVTTTNTTTDTTNNNCPTATENTSNTDTNNNSNTNSNDYVTPNPDLNTERNDTTETEGDEDLKEFLEASKQEYLKEQSLRMAEEESVRQAMRLSLLDLMK